MYNDVIAMKLKSSLRKFYSRQVLIYKTVDNTLKIEQHEPYHV